MKKPYRNARADDNESGLDIYLREISKYPLLTREEEQELAKRCVAGDEQARIKLIQSNLRFVVSEAKEHQNRGLPLQDLINEGNYGLMHAVKKFDPDHGVKLISYAVWWIRQRMLAAIASYQGPMRIPLNRTADLNLLRRTASAIQTEREVSYENALYLAEEKLKQEGKEVSELTWIALYHKTAPVELDKPIGESGQKTPSDLLAGNGENHADTVANDDLESRINARVHANTAPTSRHDLSPRERKIINMYFGLNGEQERTLEDIGSLLGVTRERVRQIKERAINRLRHDPSVRKLAEDYGIIPDSPKYRPNA